MYPYTLTQITRSYYKGAAGCLLVYDVTARDTFAHLPSWLHDVREQAEENATIALVGNMADRPTDQRAVSKEEAETFAAENKYVTSIHAASCFSRQAPRRVRMSSKCSRPWQVQSSRATKPTRPRSNHLPQQ